jgi:hypothetical protein
VWPDVSERITFNKILDMAERPKFANTDDYFASVTPESKIALREIRKIIQEKVPNATETISYLVHGHSRGRSHQSMPWLGFESSTGEQN